MGRDLALADRLRARGLTVVEVAGWQTRGQDNLNAAVSVNHHTAGGPNGNAPSLGVCINGRAGIPGPLANTLQARDNTIYVIAAGTANNAGKGGWAGFSGNSRTNGHEVENVGTADEPWRPDQIETMCLVHAAWCDDPSNGPASVANICQHKEWTTRKIDAHDINGDDFRGRIAALLGGGQPVPQPPPAPPVPPAPPPPSVGELQWPLITKDANDRLAPHVRIVQQVSGAGVDGDFGPQTEGKVRGYQNALQLPVNGRVDNRTGTAIVQNVLRDMGFDPGPVDGIYGAGTTSAVARFQQAHGLAADGVFGPRSTQKLWEVMGSP